MTATPDLAAIEPLFIRADATAIPLPDGSVDLIVTSPPYFALRDYRDGDESVTGQIGAEPTPQQFLAALWRVMDECWRVLAPGGSVVVNLGDKYAMDGKWGGRSGAKNHASQHHVRRRTEYRAKSLMGLPWQFALGCTNPAIRCATETPWLTPSEVDHPQWILRAEVIWDKPNGLPESVRDRVRRSHEQWFHFTKSERYYSAIDLIRQPHKHGGAGVSWADRKSAGNQTYSPDGHLGATGVRRSMAGNPLGALPGSVWTIATEPLPTQAIRAAGHTEHFAAFPSEWPRRWILALAPTHGICTTCGEGLRPVKSAVGERGEARDYNPHLGGRTTPPQWKGGVNPNPRTIVGFVCGCDEPIHSPTGRSRSADPSRETGRAGLNRPRGDDEGSTVTTRWEHAHWAAELRTSPHRARIERLAARLHGPTAFAHWIRTDTAGARPIPVAFRAALLRRGWLTSPPTMAGRVTRPAVVLDPFSGTGTTAITACALGCQGIGIDLSEAYIRLAEWRHKDGRLAEKVRERTHGKPPSRRSRAPKPAAQPPLFPEAA